jgi:3'(2'), 5'-bisphosphate nucleotidase
MNRISRGAFPNPQFNYVYSGLVGHVTVLVGIAVNGIPVGGVIHQPFYGTEGNQGRTIWGIPGVGLGGIDITKPPANTRIIATTRAHSTPRVEATLAALEPTEILRVGGAGHKVGMSFCIMFIANGIKITNN